VLEQGAVDEVHLAPDLLALENTQPLKFPQVLRAGLSGAHAGTFQELDLAVRLSEEKWLRMFGQSFLRINKVTALRFQAAIAAPVLLK